MDSSRFATPLRGASARQAEQMRGEDLFCRITGGEDDRNAAFNQQVCDGKNQFAVEIDVENSDVSGQRFGQLSE